MANVTTDFNVTPYYDDYDEDKQFLRVLFRPGFAVQGRELTQLQTILQKQSSRLGDHIFKDGSKVLGGEVTLDTEVTFLKLTTADTATDFSSSIISDTSVTVGAGVTRAQVIAAIDLVGSDAPTLIVKFISGTAFTAGSTIYLEGSISTTATVASIAHTGGASIVSINRGVFFVNGFFVLCLAQTLVLEKYSNEPTYRLGLTTTESIIDSDTDTTLLDSASGTTNANAPGATRFKIELVLAKKQTTSTDPVAANADSNFIELMRVVAGTPTKNVKYPVYGEIEKTLARRTYDESGDYTIKPFPIQVIDHQGATGVTSASVDTTITGVLTDFENDFVVGDNIYLSSDSTATANVSSITNATSMVVSTALGDGTSQVLHNNNRVSAALEPGKAYVKGYEYESIGAEYVDVKKGREVFTQTTFPINPNFGNNVKVTNFNAGNSEESNFDPEAIATSFDLHSVQLSNIVSTTANSYNSTKIGTTRIRQIDYDSGAFTNVATSNTAIFDMYIFDTALSSLTANVGIGGYVSGETSILLEAAKTSTKLGAYDGAKITLGSETREVILSGVIIGIGLEESTGDGDIIINSTDGSALTDSGDKILNENGIGATINLAFSTSVDIANQVSITSSTREMESIAIANSTYGLANTPGMDIDLTSKVDTGDATSNTQLFDTDTNSLVFPIGFDNVKGIGSQDGTTFTAEGIKYQRKEKIAISFSFATSTGATVTSPTGSTFETEGLAGAGTALSNPAANYILVAATDGASVTATGTGDSVAIASGEVIDVIVTCTAATNQVTITPRRDGVTFGGGTLSGLVYATCDYAAKSPKTKTRVNATSIAAASGITHSGVLLDTAGTDAQHNERLANGHAVVAAVTGTQSLGVSDVLQVTNVIEAAAAGSDAATQFAIVSTAQGNTAHVNNITSRFSFNNGQKDNFYDHGSITLKAGQTPPANNVLITFDYYSHSAANSYFSVESYSDDYADIPSFTSPSTGITKQLRDCIDFRPTKGVANGATGAGGLLANDDLPDADVSITANVVYYLPRKDKLTLTKDRTFQVITGISSEDPILPADDEDAMTLYNLDIPAFTFNASDCDTQYIDNRRFTMRDIGKIEKRVDQLEYYTALTLLEKEANDLSIKDSASGTERFKNGIVVDSFNGHNIGDVSNEDFKAAIDFELKELRPSFSADSFRFDIDTTGSSANTAKTGDLITLAYSSANLVVQPLASNTETINPYSTTQFNGQLTLAPPNDVWFAETGRPTVLINLEGLNDHWVQGNNNGFDKQWDDWSFTWSGVQVNNDNLIKSRKTGTTSNTISRDTNVTSKNKTRTGIISSTPPETIKRAVGNRTVSITIVPYIRQQTISFVARGVKPNGTFYPYFDNTLVSANTKQGYVLSYTANTGSANSGVFGTGGDKQTVTGSSGATGVSLYQNSSSVIIGDIIQTVTLSANTHLVDPDAVIGESITFSNSTTTATATLQSVNATAATITVNSISGDFGTTTTSVVGATSGIYISSGTTSVTVTGAGGFATGELFTGTGSAKSNGNVSAVATNNPTFSTALQADRNGVVAGELVIPENTFRVGERLFRLTDSSTDTIASTESVAERIFRVQGLLESRTGRMSSTRPMDAKRENVKEKNVTQDTINRVSTSTNWINPLSQTFIVDKSEHENGIYASSIDIFFSTVDATMPVTLQLRPVINEVPSSSQIIPFSEVILNPSDATANSSAPSVATAATFTRFTFESPVYLYPDEYAIVLTTPSDAYSVHIANLGETVKNTTDIKVSQQPFVASFYQPQNSSIWQPNVEKQMMFRVNRCEFNTGTHAVYLSSIAEPLSGNTSGINYDVFKLSTSELTFSNTSIDYSFRGIDESKTVASDANRTAQIDATFTSFSANKNITLSTQKKTAAAVSTTGLNSYAANNFYLRATISTTDTKISPAIDLSRINLITVENQVNLGSLANSDIVITNGGAGYPASGATATFSAPTSGTTATASVTVSANVVTAITVTNGGTGYYETPTLTLSDAVTGSNHATATVQSELNASGGNSKSRYITRRVNLEDGFDAQDIRVILNAYKPKDTEIKVYYRVWNAEDPGDFEEKPYVLMTQETDSNLISANESIINQYSYKSVDGAITYISGGQTYDKFKTFSLKIVLAASSSTVIPKIKDMKAIALDF
jgi:hypothetical protein